MIKIAYYGFGWADNIGNAFIDKGLLYSLTTACPDAHIYGVSNIGPYLKYRYANRFPFCMFQGKDSTTRSFDLRTLAEVDCIVMGGAMLTNYWLAFNQSLVSWLQRSGVPVILQGVGGGNIYNDSIASAVKIFLDSINLRAICTRDTQTYEMYGELAPRAHDGIDNAFYLSDCFDPMPLNIHKYTMLVFDNMRQPAGLPLSKDEDVISAYHASSELGRLEYLIKNPLKYLSLASRKHLISDCPDDYLHLYGQAMRIFTDRVHACIATLSFGGEARLFTKSHRAYLFESAGVGRIVTDMVRLDPEFISDKKARQLAFLASVLAE